MRALTALWVAGLAALSLQPARPAHNSPLFWFHRPVHLLAFALTALVLWRFFADGEQAAGQATSLRRVPQPAPSPLAAGSWIKALFATVLLGVLLEVLQHLIYRCRMEWHDVRDDAAAALAAILLACAVRSARPLWWRLSVSLRNPH